jgi:hypothetical protein
VVDETGHFVFANPMTPEGLELDPRRDDPPAPELPAAAHEEARPDAA